MFYKKEVIDFRHSYPVTLLSSRSYFGEDEKTYYSQLLSNLSLSPLAFPSPHTGTEGVFCIHILKEIFLRVRAFVAGRTVRKEQSLYLKNTLMIIMFV